MGARTQTIVRWILEQTDRIEQATRLKLIFNCRGDHVIPITEEYWDSESIATDN